MSNLRTAFSILAALAVGTAVASEPRDTSLVYLDLSGKVMHLPASGGTPTVLVEQAGAGPDGIAVDERTGQIYWTNMGKVTVDDGSIMRVDADGRNLTTIVQPGGTFTPKQLKIDTQNRKLYWSDREGMRVMRSNLDGSHIETLIVTGSGDAERTDQARWCVGIALDVERGKVYWTQKGGDNAHTGAIKRANIDLPAGQSPANRTDIEVLFSNLPEPIDLDLDLRKRQIYWTDRGDNTISRAPMDFKGDAQRSFDPSKRTDRVILVRDLHEFIGITLDLDNKKMYYTSLRGELGVSKLNGKKSKLLLKDAGRFTGIALAGKKEEVSHRDR
jgi:sugar lactone lactonase YvrE